VAGANDDRTKSKAMPAPLASDRSRLHAFWAGGHVSVELPETGTLTIGRAMECDLRVDDESVSRRHVSVHCDEELVVEDLGSWNGTRLGGRVMKWNEKAALRSGEVVEIGSAILVVRAGLAASGGDTRALAREAHEDSQGRFAELERLSDLVAKSSIDVVLLGETGVGKEVFAERIHRGSARSGHSFVRLNCSSLPDSLLEAELFGYEKGAFTGAVHAKAGLLESADRGTVLLDEVGDLPVATQPKLLRVIERREVLRLGSLKPRTIDVRFIAATHRDLAAAIRDGRFREDLYHRLNGITLTIPPLRDRPWQIRGLAEGFMREACERGDRSSLRLADAAQAELERHDWPGNVRELRKVIERAVVLSGGDVIEAAHIALDGSARSPGGARVSSAPARDPRDPGSHARALAALEHEKHALERQRVLDALERGGGNQTKAAELLGVSRRTLLNWLDTYDVPRPRKKS
jgi:two-component system response regulator AtoC